MALDNSIGTMCLVTYFKYWLFVLRYAFIEFASFEDAKEALNSCNKREIEGRAIRLELQGPRGSPNARSRELH